MPSLFLSYSRRDLAVVVELRERLQEAGFRGIFHDVDPERGIASGAAWEQTLWREVHRADAVVFVSSPDAAGSPWCIAELAVARAAGRPVFPVLLNGTLPPLLSDTQAIPVDGDLDS